jgi:ATP-dependent DNA helicase RecQ
MKKFKLLKEYFGHDNFRQLQEEAVDATLNAQDLLMILPTGGGKSLCYQLPSLLLDGVSVVISPLLALMHDQVVALRANGISAAMINSMLSIEEIKEVEQKLLKGEIKLLYIAPERLSSDYFLSFLKRLKINFFVVDEAHCVSEWGHEFREDYRKLSLLKEHFTNTPIAAFTATATKIVEQDIINNLSLNNPVQLRGSLFRENLTINVDYKIGDGKKQLLEFIDSRRGEAGIVYTLSRKSTESIASFLQKNGIKAKAYHGALSSEVKNQTYAEFVSDEIDVVVATIAFGMGIDKSNIRYVVHLSLPKSIESYYQEIGRAGRDGLSSQTLLLFSMQDVVAQKSFIDPLSASEHKMNTLNKLDYMVKYANSELCRHQQIAKYFDDNINECKSLCDNCLNIEREVVDITVDVQKLLSAIYRTKESFGVHYIVDILRGSKDKRILENEHDKLSVYNIGSNYQKPQWLSIANRALELELVDIGEFKVYKITSKGLKFLKSKEQINIRKERLSKKSYKDKRVVAQDLDYNQSIFNTLRELRKEIAIKENIPPYIVFSDKSLKDMASKLPQTKEQMLEVHGVGEVKYKRYGERFLELLNS